MKVVLGKINIAPARWRARLASLIAVFAGVVGLGLDSARAQIPMSGGSYSQNFDTLGNAAANWTNNVTVPGWYSGKGSGDSTN